MSNFVNAKKSRTGTTSSAAPAAAAAPAVISEKKARSSTTSLVPVDAPKKTRTASTSLSTSAEQADSATVAAVVVSPGRKGTASALDAAHSSYADANAAAATALASLPTLKTVALGAYAFVNVAKHAESGELFAVKVADKATLVHLHLARAVVRERKILASLDTPWVVKLKRSLRDERRVYLQLALVGGGTLFSHLAQGGVMSEKTALHYAAELLCALEALHGAGVAHGCLAPEHVGIDGDGHVVLLGFAHARWLTKVEMAGDNAADDEDLGTVARGMPCYVAPERLRGLPARAETDLWSFGSVVHDMLAGSPPFLASSPDASFELICEGRPNIAKSVPAPAAAMIRKLLHADPAKRDDIAAVREQKWFKGVDWAATAKRKVAAPLADAAAKLQKDLAKAGAKKDREEATLTEPPAVGPPVDVDGSVFGSF
jgi:serine/threonine protein kinase